VVLHGSGYSIQKLALHDADTLRQLDSNGKEIASKLNYDLKRAPKFAPIDQQGKAKISLEKTDWRLTQLRETAIKANSQTSEPYFALDPEGHRIAGAHATV
jgi:hypothetical protein